MAKTMLWAWAGAFLIMSYTTMAFIFVIISWLVYTTKNEQQKTVYFIYGSIPLGLSIAVLICSIIAKFQLWPWYSNSIRMTVFLFVITGMIFATALLFLKNPIKTKFVKEMILETLLFIALTFAIIFMDFDKLITALSSNEANKVRERWKSEALKDDTLFRRNLQTTFKDSHTEEEVVNLVGNSKLYLDKENFIDSLSSGKRKLFLNGKLDDTANNIYLVKVLEDNGVSLVTYFNFLVDVNKMTILNPTGKLEE